MAAAGRLSLVLCLADMQVFCCLLVCTVAR